MIKALVALAVVCILIAAIPPIAVYLHLKDTLELHQEQIEAYQKQLEKNEVYMDKFRGFFTPYSSFDPYLMEPYIETKLGWYLHGSSDLVASSRNKLTLYGQVLNIGAETAYNCKLIIHFYSRNTVIQTSEVNMGTIGYWGEQYVRENIDCNMADSVTRIEVERTWTSTP